MPVSDLMPETDQHFRPLPTPAHNLCQWYSHWPVRRTYATEFKQGPSFLRPWMCGYRNDFGFSGTCEPDEYLGLAELIIQEGSLGEVCVEAV